MYLSNKTLVEINLIQFFQKLSERYDKNNTKAHN